MSAEVVEVSDTSDGVELVYRQNGENSTITVDAVLVAGRLTGSGGRTAPESLYALFLMPLLSRVGLTEREARARG